MTANKTFKSKKSASQAAATATVATEQEDKVTFRKMKDAAIEAALIDVPTSIFCGEGFTKFHRETYVDTEYFTVYALAYLYANKLAESGVQELNLGQMTVLQEALEETITTVFGQFNAWRTRALMIRSAGQQMVDM